MGDHRASIKIQAEFHGVKRECDMWINWVQVMPSAVEDFFRELYNEGHIEYDLKMADYYAKQREEAEKKEYERLKEKFKDAN